MLLLDGKEYVKSVLLLEAEIVFFFQRQQRTSWNQNETIFLNILKLWKFYPK